MILGPVASGAPIKSSLKVKSIHHTLSTQPCPPRRGAGSARK
jgi:hypothetical protein